MMINIIMLITRINGIDRVDSPFGAFTAGLSLFITGINSLAVCVDWVGTKPGGKVALACPGSCDDAVV